MRIITCYQDDVTQWPVKCESEPAVYNIWISTCVKISFQLRVKKTVLVSLKFRGTL